MILTKWTIKFLAILVFELDLFVNELLVISINIFIILHFQHIFFFFTHFFII